MVDLGMAAKVRPALVISIPTEDTDRALVTLVPHTTSPRQSRFEAAGPVSYLRVGVFDAQNLVTIPHAKLIRSLGKLSGAQLASVERAVCLWLGLSTCLLARLAWVRLVSMWITLRRKERSIRLRSVSRERQLADAGVENVSTTLPDLAVSSIKAR